MLISKVDGEPVQSSNLGPLLAAAGFSTGHKGYLKRAPIDGTGLRLRAPLGQMRGPLGPDLARTSAVREADLDPERDPDPERDLDLDPERDPDLDLERGPDRDRA